MVLTRLVTAEFPQPPSHGAVVDQCHLEGERREGVYKGEHNCEDMDALSGQRRR